MVSGVPRVQEGQGDSMLLAAAVWSLEETNRFELHESLGRWAGDSYSLAIVNDHVPRSPAFAKGIECQGDVLERPFGSDERVQPE